MSLPANKLPNSGFLQECFSYNAETGKLYWRSRPENHFKSSKARAIWLSRYANTEAGRVDRGGYVRVGLVGKLLAVHRIIWKMVNGEDPVKHIDHINGVKSDNRIANLREADDFENTWNADTPSTNTTGYKGVSKKLMNGTVKYRAYIGKGRKHKHIGYFDTPEEAHRAYRNAAHALYGEFANFGRDSQ